MPLVVANPFPADSIVVPEWDRIRVIDPETGHVDAYGDLLVYARTGVIGADGSLLFAGPRLNSGSKVGLVGLSPDDGSQTLIADDLVIPGVFPFPDRPVEPATPRAMAIEAGGTVIIAGRYRDGVTGLISAWLLRVDPETGESELVGPLSGDPVSLAVAPTGDLIVGYESGGLSRLHPDSGAEVFLAADLFAPASLAVTADYRIVAVDRILGSLIVFDWNGGSRTVVAHMGLLMTPVGVQIDRHGNYLVVNQTPGVVRVDAETGAQSLVSDLGTPIQEIVPIPTLFPGDIVVADSGSSSLIAVDGRNGRRLVITQNDQLILPADIAFDSKGNLVVVDEGSLAVVLVDVRSGEQTLLSSGDLLEKPRYLAIAASGDIFVTDHDTDAVIRIDPETGIQTLVSQGGLLAGPSGIVVDDTGDLIVASPGAAMILRIDPENGVQGVVSQDENLQVPRGLVIDSQGDLLVVDRAAELVIEIDLETGSQAIISSGNALKQALDIAIDQNGALLVTDVIQDALTRIDPATGKQAAVTFFETSVYGPYGIAVVPKIQTPLTPGDLVLAVQDEILRVDPVTGEVATLAWFDARAVAIDATGFLIAADESTGSIVRIDPETGSERQVASGPALEEPKAISIDKRGDILVLTERWLVRIDARSGAQTKVAAAPLSNEEVRYLLVDMALGQNGVPHSILLRHGLGGGGGLGSMSLLGVGRLWGSTALWDVASATAPDGNIFLMDGVYIRHLDAAQADVTIVLEADTSLESGERFRDALGMGPDGDFFLAVAPASIFSDREEALLRVDADTFERTVISTSSTVTSPRDIAVVRRDRDNDGAADSVDGYPDNSKRIFLPEVGWEGSLATFAVLAVMTRRARRV